MNTTKGDLIAYAKQGRFDVIIHGCNCFNSMGAGIARSIKTSFPEAYAVDSRTKRGDLRKLGDYTVAVVDLPGSGKKLAVVNAYTQFRYGGRRRNVDYDAIRQVFRRIKQNFSGKSIGFPRIGAGYAGGKWTLIAQIISEELEGEDFTLVEYVPQR